MARNLYGKIEQNYHCKGGIIKKRITDLARLHVNNISKATQSYELFSERIASLFSKKVKENSISFADVGQHFGEIVLPKIIQSPLHFSAAYFFSIFIFDGLYSRLTTALVLNGIGLSILAMETTKRLSEYTPPSFFKDLDNFVSSRESQILNELDRTLNPSNLEKKAFKIALRQISFDDFPFKAFTRVKSPRQKTGKQRFFSSPLKTNPRIELECLKRNISSSKEGLRLVKQCKEFEEDRENYRRNYSKNYELRKNYWKLFIKEHQAKAMFFEKGERHDWQLYTLGDLAVAQAHIKGSKTDQIVSKEQFAKNITSEAEKFSNTFSVKSKIFREHLTIAKKVHKSILNCKYPNQ